MLYSPRHDNAITGRNLAHGRRTPTELGFVGAEPIKGRLIGDHTCHVGNLPTNADTPIFEMCRLLLLHGYAPGRPLLVFRGNTLAVTVRTIREGAGLSVNGKGSAFYRLRKVCIGPPVRKSASPLISRPLVGCPTVAKSPTGPQSRSSHIPTSSVLATAFSALRRRKRIASPTSKQQNERRN